MENVGRFFTAIVNGFKMKITLYGFTFSFWEIFLICSLAEIVIIAIVKFFDD